MADAPAAATADPAGAIATADPGGAGSPAKPWYDGIDTETVGYWDNKGWKKDDPKAVVTEATKQARELQKHFGVPADQLLKLPKDQTDEAGWNGIYQRLGAPKEAKEYDFSSIKFSDGSALSELAGFEDAMRSTLFSSHVAKDKAGEIIKSVVKFMDGAEATQSAEAAARKAENLQSLNKNWGANAELNRLTAMQGARRLGLTPDGLAALESQVGYANLMEAMRKIGAGTTEDTFVEGGRSGHPTTQAGAAARKAELMGDSAWVTRYLEGNAEARREMDNLNLLISGEAA